MSLSLYVVVVLATAATDVVVGDDVAGAKVDDNVLVTVDVLPLTVAVVVAVVAVVAVVTVVAVAVVAVVALLLLPVILLMLLLCCCCW